MDVQFIANFRIRAQHWSVANGNKELMMEEARSLSSKRPFASEEFLPSNDHMQKQNLNCRVDHNVFAVHEFLELQDTKIAQANISNHSFLIKFLQFLVGIYKMTG
jgi:hypothetical protein